MKITEHFTKHPASVGESYGEHFQMAVGFSVRMMAGGLACMVHAILPFMFVKTGSRIIDGLHDRMVVNRHKASAKPVAAGAAVETGPAA